MALKQELDRQRKQNEPQVKRDPSLSIDGYFFMMGSDSDQYGQGTIGIMQGKNRLVTLSYSAWQKIDAWMNQHADHFNAQLDKETALLNAIKRR